MPLAKDDDVIEAVAPDGADEPLRERILPRRLRRRENSQALHAPPEPLAVDLVAIAEEVGRRGVVREGVHDLLGRPSGSGMLGDVEVENTPAVVGEHDEDEEHPQAGAGDGEEVDGNQVPDVVGEEGSPGLGRWSAPLREQPRDGALGNMNAELQQLPVDSGSTPKRIGCGHAGDQRLGHDVDGRAAGDGPAGELGPVLAEAAALPPQDGVGRHDD